MGTGGMTAAVGIVGSALLPASSAPAAWVVALAGIGLVSIALRRRPTTRVRFV